MAVSFGGIPEVGLYGAAFTDADKLKNADALLIALLNKRREMECPSLARCRISRHGPDTLSRLLTTRDNVKSGVLSQIQGIEELTQLLDGMCDIGSK